VVETISQLAVASWYPYVRIAIPSSTPQILFHRMSFGNPLTLRSTRALANQNLNISSTSPLRHLLLKHATWPEVTERFDVFNASA
ncbi:hypothetical protein, partial [Burkholderia ambifaria]|uniref:hypothetical protein n=1 Tax=Burkholderia ambifaria TaxID=152480 RepID=UPI001ABB857F